MRREGCGFDVVSGGELRRVLAVGAKPSSVVFAGVGKTVAEMEEAIEAGILFFNVESEEEVEVLAATAARVGRRAGVAIRLNPDVDPKTHTYISTGKKESKFGVDIERGEALARRVLALPSLELRGLQCHIGSQLTTRRALRRGPRAHASRSPRRSAPTRRRSSGSTWAAASASTTRTTSRRPIDAYAKAVAPVLRGTGLRLVLEPGRVIVGNAGVLLTRVLYRKISGDKRFVIVDAGMNDLIRPSLYGSYHRIWPVLGDAPPPLGTESDLPLHDIVGPVCESGDFLAKDRPFPPDTKAGDLLAVMSAGAYGFVMASQYNARPRPPEILVDGARYAVARRRETYDDLVRGETARPAWAKVGGRAASKATAAPSGDGKGARKGKGGGTGKAPTAGKKRSAAPKPVAGRSESSKSRRSP